MGQPDFVVDDHNALQRAAAKVKAAGDRKLQLALRRNMRAAALHIQPQIRASAKATLPKRGGLADLIADRVKLNTSVGLGKVVRVKITGKDTYQLKAMNEGHLRHPVYPKGPRDSWTWAAQNIRTGWFTTPIERNAPALRKAVISACDEVAKEIEKG